MECYICADEVCDPLRICACSSQYLHLQCQRRLLETVSPDGRCTVCRQRYTNVVCLHRSKDAKDATSGPRPASLISWYKLLAYFITLLGTLSSLCTWSRLCDTVQTHSIIMSAESQKSATSLAAVLILVHRHRLLICYVTVTLVHILFIGVAHIYLICLIRVEIRAEVRRQTASSFASSDRPASFERWVVDGDAGTPSPEIA